jgi:hypothetical protein
MRKALGLFAAVMFFTLCLVEAQEKLFVVSAQGSDSTDEIYRYDVAGPHGPVRLDLVMQGENLMQPYGVAFGSGNELFVTNRAWSRGAPSVARFLRPASRIPQFNGLIPLLDPAPSGAVFRAGELFVVQAGSGFVSRFLLDHQRNALPNGVIAMDWSIRNATVNPVTGELFVTQCCGMNQISRFLFDSDGNAIPNGTITDPSLDNPHDLVFDAKGELFVANAFGETVSRFTFDNTGNAVPNGVIADNPGAIGLAFSPWGELFVSSHFQPTVFRWTFDKTGQAHSNGSFATPQTLADLGFLPVASKTTVITSGSPSFVGQPVTFTANVISKYGSIPDGELVTFFDGTRALGSVALANGTAAYATSSLSAKTHYIKAVYAGDATFLRGTGLLHQIVNKYPTTTTLSSSARRSSYGQPVTFTATVTPTGPYSLTGKVKFLDWSLVIGSATLNGGVASLTTSKLLTGTHLITAQYVGDAVNDTSTSSALTHVVQ